MKNKILIIVSLTGILMTADLTAQQDNKPATPQQSQPAQSAPAAPTIQRDRTEILARYLNLSDEQKEKVKPIIDEETKKIQELRQQKDLSQQERTAKIREIREQTYQKMKPILTEEQWKKYYRPLQPATPPPPQTPPAPANQKQEGKK